jgi:hypothetical protein
MWKLKKKSVTPWTTAWRRDSSVGVATLYGIGGPGIESRWGDIFPTSPERPCGPPSLLYDGYQVFHGGKASGTWHWPPNPFSAEVKETMELYRYSTSGSSWPVLGWILPLLKRNCQRADFYETLCCLTQSFIQLRQTIWALIGIQFYRGKVRRTCSAHKVCFFVSSRALKSAVYTEHIHTLCGGKIVY